jgi:hypothetical protein
MLCLFCSHICLCHLECDFCSCLYLEVNWFPKKDLPRNESVSEDVEVEPKDHTVTVPTREGITHKPDTPEDRYHRRQRRSKQHL